IRGSKPITMLAESASSFGRQSVWHAAAVSTIIGTAACSAASVPQDALVAFICSLTAFSVAFCAELSCAEPPLRRIGADSPAVVLGTRAAPDTGGGAAAVPFGGGAAVVPPGGGAAAVPFGGGAAAVPPPPSCSSSASTAS